MAKSRTANEAIAPAWRPLTSNILVVAYITIDGWKAVIGWVEGKNHDKEWQFVMRNGVTLDEDVARACFPQFAPLAYGR